MSMTSLTRFKSWVRSKAPLPVFAYRHPEFSNFGDELSIYLIARLTQRKVIRVERGFNKPHVAAIGSILNLTNDQSTIWGSGVISQNDEVTPPASVLAVRGPRTRAALLARDIDCPEVYGDPALLLPLVYRGAEPVHELGIVPHYVDYDQAVAQFKDDVPIIDVRQPLETVLNAITSCRHIVSSSLHGVIVAETMGRRGCWAKFSDKLTGDDTKFHDFYESVNLTAPSPLMLDDQSPSPAALRDAVNEQWRPMTFDPRPLLGAAPFSLRRNVVDSHMQTPGHE